MLAFLPRQECRFLRSFRYPSRLTPTQSVMFLYRSIGLVCIVSATCTFPVLVANPAYEPGWDELLEVYFGAEHLEPQPYQGPSSNFERGPDSMPTNNLLDEPSAISRKRKPVAAVQATRTSPRYTRRPQGSGEPGLIELRYNQPSNLLQSVSPGEPRGQFHTADFAQSSEQSAINFSKGFVMPSESDILTINGEDLDKLMCKHFSDRLEELMLKQHQACRLTSKPKRLDQLYELPNGLGLFACNKDLSCFRMMEQDTTMRQTILFPRIRKIFQTLWEHNSKLLASELPEDSKSYIANYKEAQNEAMSWFWRTLTVSDDFGSQPVFGFRDPQKNVVLGEAQLTLQKCLNHPAKDNDEVYSAAGENLLRIYRQQRRRGKLPVPRTKQTSTMNTHVQTGPPVQLPTHYGI